MADDEEECVAELAAALDAWGAPSAPLTGDTAVPGVLCAVLVDIGCLHCGEATQVRGVIPHPSDWRAAFLDECRRLEIDPAGIAVEAVPFDEFLKAGGSAAVAGVAYRRLRDEDGERVSRFLALIVSRII